MTVETPRGVGRPPLTDRASLLAAARRIGFTNVSVAAVTAEVGVKYSTFYRHIPSLQAMQSALVDEVLEEAAFPAPTTPWQDCLRQTSAALFDLLHRNPGLAQVLVALPRNPHRLVELWARTTDVMLEAGFDPTDAVLATIGTFELAVQPGISGPGPAAEIVKRTHASLTPELIPPRPSDAMAYTLDVPVAEWVAAKVDLLIDGLAARVAAPPERHTR